MPLHPQVKKFLNTVKAAGDTFDWNSLAADLPVNTVKKEMTIPVSKEGTIPAKVFDVAGETEQQKAVLIYIPGGGFGPYLQDAHDHACATMAQTANCRVIMIEPRPEKAPIQVEDACSAIKYIMENADKFNINPADTALGGDSSGANLALSAALNLSKDGIELQQLVLISGTYDLTMNTENIKGETYKSQYQSNEQKDILSEQMFDDMFSAYLSEGLNKDDPRVSPYFRDADIRMLTTKVTLIVSEYDGVRHQTHQLADHFDQCGVKYMLTVVPGQTHSALVNRKSVTEAENPAVIAGIALQDKLTQGPSSYCCVM